MKVTNKHTLNIFLTLLLITVLHSTVLAQSTRSLINEGVDQYEAENFADSEVSFRKSAEKDLENFKTHFNLGDALYKQQRYDEAIQSFKNSIALTENDLEKSGAYYNIGNSFLKAQKLDEAIQAYKNALKLNPNDIESKYNLSYSIKEKEKQQQNQDQNKDQNKDQDKNKDQNKQNQDKNQDQNKDNQDQNKDQQKQDQNQDQQNKDQNQNQNQNQDQQQQQQPQPKDQISKEEAQRILEALKNNESDLQKKLRKQKGQPVKVEKDW